MHEPERGASALLEKITAKVHLDTATGVRSVLDRRKVRFSIGFRILEPILLSTLLRPRTDRTPGQSPLRGSVKMHRNGSAAVAKIWLKKRNRWVEGGFVTALFCTPN
jgi:hypothetical protein